MLDDGTVAFHLPIERSLGNLVEAETKYKYKLHNNIEKKERHIVHYSGKSKENCSPLLNWTIKY